MGKIAAVLGWVMCLCMIFVHVSQYGTRWEFGRYGMARSLIAADGRHYLDGAVVPGFVLHFRAQGIEEEVQLGLWLLSPAGLVLIAFMEVRRWLRQKRLLAELSREYGLSEREIKAILLSDDEE